jgi:YfiH family protein
VLREVSSGLVTYRFDSLSDESLSHAVFTRLGGVSQGPFATLNVGSSVGDDPAAVMENHVRIYHHMAITASHVATGHQVHGNQVAVVTRKDGGRAFSSTDGLITAVPGLGLMLRFADCQPILLLDPVRSVLGLIHAGWRGLAQGVAYRAVEAMQRAFGSDPRDLIAALGPAIGACCYVVGDNVATAMGYALPNWRHVLKQEGTSWRFDLPAANAQQLAAAGVSQIEQAGICTCCRSDEFYSHRAENGRTGRFAVLAYLKPGATPGVDRREMSRASSPPSAETLTPGSLHPTGFPAFGEASPAAPEATEDPCGTSNNHLQ